MITCSPHTQQGFAPCSTPRPGSNCLRDGRFASWGVIGAEEAPATAALPDPSVATGADATYPKQDGTLLLQPLFQIPPWLLGQMLHTQSKTARSCYSRSSRSLRGCWVRCYIPKARRHGHLLEVTIGGQAGGKEGQTANSPNTVTASPLFPSHNSSSQFSTENRCCSLKCL
jgi:hypothetical protein